MTFNPFHISLLQINTPQQKQSTELPGSQFRTIYNWIQAVSNLAGGMVPYVWYNGQKARWHIQPFSLTQMESYMLLDYL